MYGAVFFAVLEEAVSSGVTGDEVTAVSLLVCFLLNSEYMYVLSVYYFTVVTSGKPGNLVFF